MVRKLLQKRINEIMEKFKDKKILAEFSSANFFGQESKGSKQIRGNGVLVLTNKEFFFEMWHPKTILQIPISSIQRVETPKKHLGKTKFRSLLKVIFENDKRETDSAAWLINHLQQWKESIENLIDKE